MGSVDWGNLTVELAARSSYGGQGESFPTKKIGHGEDGSTRWISGVPLNIPFYPSILFSLVDDSGDPEFDCDVTVDHRSLYVLPVVLQWGWQSPSTYRQLAADHERIRAAFSPQETLGKPDIYVDLPDNLKADFRESVCTHTLVTVSKTVFDSLFILDN